MPGHRQIEQYGVNPVGMFANSTNPLVSIRGGEHS